MKKIFQTMIISLLLILTCSNTFANNPFVIIMYDSETEKSIGLFPPKRSVWASAIDKLNKLNANAVVLKFFFDMSKPEDLLLSNSFQSMPTFLQACFNETDPSNNKLDKRFIIKVDQEYKNILTGNKGWLPVKELASNTFDIGFVDIRNMNSIPIIEKYNNNYVKSLYYSILKYVYKDLRLEKNVLINGNKKITLNQYSEMDVNYPETDELSYISLIDLINDKIDKEQIKNKIVIIGYDGIQSETQNISTGKVNTHRVFIYGLIDMYNQLAP